MTIDEAIKSGKIKLRAPLPLVGADKLTGDFSDLWGDASMLSGDCTGLSGYCSGLSGDCSELRGECAEIVSALKAALNPQAQPPASQGEEA